MTYWKQCMNYSQKPKKSCLGITSPISSLEPNASSSLVLNFAASPDFFFCLCLAIHAALSLPPFPDCLLIQFDKGEARFEVGKGERRGSALKHRRRWISRCKCLSLDLKSGQECQSERKESLALIEEQRGEEMYTSRTIIDLSIYLFVKI